MTLRVSRRETALRQTEGDIMFLHSWCFTFLGQLACSVPSAGTGSECVRLAEGGCWFERYIREYLEYMKHLAHISFFF